MRSGDWTDSIEALSFRWGHTVSASATTLIAAGIGFLSNCIVAFSTWKRRERYPRAVRGGYTRRLGKYHFPRFLFLSAAFLASITVTLLVLAIVFSGDHSPRLWIKSPAENNRVGLSIAVRGGSSHLGSNRYIWLFVKPSSTTQYYPQSGPVFKRPNGDWSDIAKLGDAASPPLSGAVFDVLAVIVDSRANTAILRYQARSRSTQANPGLGTLPR